MAAASPTSPVAEGHATLPAQRTTKPAWARYLTALRTRRGLTSAAAARKMGITQPTWTGFESGTRVRDGRRTPVIPKEETLLRISDALDLTPGEYEQLFALATAERGHDTSEWQTRLRHARLTAKMTPAQAARHAGVSTQTYKTWERKSTGGATHDALRALLPHLGFTPEETDAFMAHVPAEVAAPRPPRQWKTPVTDIPAWSRFITDKRVTQGLHLATADQMLGQTSILRRYELGGWQRADGRRSVPTTAWLDRIAAILDMTDAETAHLHTLADTHRLTVAAQGRRPFVAELLVEARRALDTTMAEADERTSPLPYPWPRYEHGCPKALATLDGTTAQHLIATLPVRPVLAAALLSSIHSAGEPAENKYATPARDVAVSA